jgi:hypothetical protein
VMRIAYAHADQAGSEETRETWASIGATLNRRAAGGRGIGQPVA